MANWPTIGMPQLEFRDDLDLWSFDLNMSVHICRQLQLSCKSGEIPISDL